MHKDYNQEIELSLDENHQVLNLEFLKSCSSASYRAAWQDVLSIMAKQGIKKLFLNEKNMSIYPKDFEWLLKEWVPRSLPLLDKSFALSIVIPQNLYGEFSLKQALRKYLPNGTLQISCFMEPVSAKMWLIEASA